MPVDLATQREQSARRHRSLAWGSLLFLLAVGVLPLAAVGTTALQSGRGS